MKVKNIVLENRNDYNNFIKKLNFYKCFLFNNVSFKILSNVNKSEINYLCCALNIKNRRKRIVYIYDTACKMIDEININVDTCGFKENKCFVQRKLNNEKSNGCCRLCVYLSENGCITKNLTCKLFNCSEVKCRYKMLEYNDISLFKLLSLKNQFIIKHDYFSLREDVLKDLYSFSLIYSGLRILCRLVKNYFVLLKRKLTK